MSRPLRAALQLIATTGLLLASSAALPRAIAPDHRPVRADSLRVDQLPSAARSLPGSELAEQLRGLPEDQRKQRFERALLAGHVPERLRHFRPVVLRHPDLPEHRAVVWVSPDYLAVGTDEDFLRVPLGLPAAARVAEAWGMWLPTPRLVDAIYDQAELRVRPDPLPPTSAMRSVPYLLRHHALIAAQAGPRISGELIAGHKKDVVLSTRLQRRPDRVAIYGWHRQPDAPIQPLSLWHGARYADYSHGLRLVYPTAWVDGVPMPLEELLRHPELAPLISDEGPVRDAVAMLDHARTDPSLSAYAGPSVPPESRRAPTLHPPG